MHKKAEGYFTVEAAMVVPVTLGVILYIIHLLFFQYNRCLMEQDVGVLAMRGTVLQAENNQDRIEKLREQADNFYDEKYIVWRGDEIRMNMKYGKLTVEQNGDGIGMADKLWKMSACYENHVISPVTFIRTCRKFMGD